MGYCIVPGFNNRSSQKRKNWEQLEKEDKNQKYSFHSLPQDVNRKNKWLEVLYLKDWCPPKSAAVCSAHFRKEDYESHLECKRLKKDAIPFVHIISQFNIISKNIYIKNLFTKEDSEKQNTIPNVDNSRNCDIEPSTSIGELQQNTLRMKHRSTSISPERIFNSPTKCRMRKIHAEELRSLKKKLYDVNHKWIKMKEKHLTLKNMIKNLQKRNLITEDDSNVLQNLQKGIKELVKRQIKKQQCLPVSKTYNASMRQFALTLHYYSPRAYNYVRSKCLNCLPHPKILSKWYYSIDGEPGINTEALEAIKLHVRSASYKLLGALVFDEMAIRQHVDYSGDKFIGYVDYGCYIETDTTKLAKEALVFCVVCINQSWKIPIAY